MSSSECHENGSFSTASSTSPCSSPIHCSSPPSPVPQPPTNAINTSNCDKLTNPEDEDEGDDRSSGLITSGNDDSISTVDWHSQQLFRHPSNLLELFVLSESGKPIYSYTTREDIVTLLPLCQALANCFQDTLKDTIRFIITRSGLKIIFSQRTPLIFVVVTHAFSGIDGNLLINQIHAQLVSVITEKTLRSVFEQRATFDLRRLLTGNEKMVHILIEQGFIGKPIVCRRQYGQQSKLTVSPSASSLYGVDDIDAAKRSPSKGRKESQHRIVTDSSITYGYISSLAIPFSSPKQSTRSSPSSGNNSYQTYPHQVNYHRSYVNRALIPVYPLNQTVRDSITNAINSSISSVRSRIAFGLLLTIEPSDYYLNSETSPDSFLRTHQDDFPSTKILAVSNYNSKCSKLSPLDMQLIQCLVMASESQLKSVESLWLPLCLPRIDASAFMHGHISYLPNHNSSTSSPTPNVTSSPSSSPQLALILLTTDKEDFHNCQMVKDNLGERLNKIKLTSPPFSDLNIPFLQYFWYMTLRSQSIFRSSLPQFNSVVQISPLIHFVAHRMLSSRLKIFWLRSDRHKVVVLGWHSPTFQLYIQLEPTTTKSMGLNAAQTIVKWIKKEEDKLLLRDY